MRSNGISLTNCFAMCSDGGAMMKADRLPHLLCVCVCVCVGGGLEYLFGYGGEVPGGGGEAQRGESALGGGVHTGPILQQESHHVPEQELLFYYSKDYCRHID